MPRVVGVGGYNVGMDDWAAHMRRGDFAAAWDVSDAKLSARAAAGFPPCWHWPRHLQPIWDGSPVAGRRVLVRCYHGLGDTVQFVRFCRPLRAVAAEVTVWCQPPLCELVATAAGVDRVSPLHEGTPDVAYDVDVEIMELPHVLRTEWGTLPATVPYLHIDGGLAGEARPSGPPLNGLNVGVVWRSGDWDDRRSVPVALVAEALSAVPGVHPVVLQQGPAVADWPAGLGTMATSDDVVALAARMRSLDLLLTVDSFPAHLAGALAVPTWTLLHADADWRWMTGREDSPWYPTMRLFRQATAGDWRPVLRRLVDELRRAARQESRARTVLP